MSRRWAGPGVATPPDGGREGGRLMHNALLGSHGRDRQPRPSSSVASNAGAHARIDRWPGVDAGPATARLWQGP